MFAVAGRSRAASVLVQAELGLHLVERVHVVRVLLVIANSVLDEGIKFFESVRAFWMCEVVLERGQDSGTEPLVVVLGVLANDRWMYAGCDGLDGRDFVFLGAPERRDVLLLCKLVLNEGVEELVVEGLVPRLAGELLSEVRAALAHDRLEADHGGALGGNRHVLGRSGEPDDVCPVVGEHRLVPCDAQLQLRVGEPHPHHYVYHPLAVVGTGDGREEIVERCDRHGFSLGDKNAGQPHKELCLSTRVQTGGRPWFPTVGPQQPKAQPLRLAGASPSSKDSTAASVNPSCKKQNYKDRVSVSCAA